PTRAWQFSAHHVPASGARRRRSTRGVALIRVFVNERPVSVASGARVRDAVEQLDRDLAELVGRGAAYVTDGVGRPVDAGDPVGEGGAIFRVVVRARQGPPRLSKELLRRWPKAELHVHLDGCLRPETMLELGRVQRIRLPADTPEGLAQALSVKHAKSLEEYLTKYEITLSVMQTAAALERVAYEFVLDAAADGVRYVEVRYSPLLHRPALTRAKETAPTRSGRPCTIVVPGGSGTARASGRTARCSTTWSSTACRSRCASRRISTLIPCHRSRSTRSSGISTAAWS